MAAGGWEFWIDVGGTFTDCIGRTPEGRLVQHKLLSDGSYKGRAAAGSTRAMLIDPRQRAAPHGFFDGWTIRVDLPSGVGESRVKRFDAATGAFALDPPLDPVHRLETCATGAAYELRCGRPAPLIGIGRLLGRRLDEPLGDITVKLGTTRGTNALLERRGARTAFVTTAGFGDVLRIAYQDRPKLFDLHIRKPVDLYECSAEIEERIDARGGVLRAADADAVRRTLFELRARGIESLAVCLMNAYRNPAHERLVGEIAREAGFPHVALSSEVSPLQRIVPRGDTTVVEAYVTPVMRDYVDSIRAGMPHGRLKLMTSTGGLADAKSVSGKDTILSGPAGGVVGCAAVARAAGFERAIGFDMGGTSTDVCRYSGEFERRYEMRLTDDATHTAVRIVAPMLAIETIAAGGGSICGFDGVKPTVGPHSAGADPGPACYGRGGPLCITDVNLLLGRIPPGRFAFPLDVEASRRRMDELIDRIASATDTRYTREALAAGLASIANESMAAAIRRISTARGRDVRDHVLVSFGGAGGQHACAIAGLLGIRRILLHPLAGVLSAYGIGVADVRRFAARDVGQAWTPELSSELEPMFVEMERTLRDEVVAEGVPAERITPAGRSLDIRYAGQETAINVPRPADGDYPPAFEAAHRRMYGFAFEGRAMEVRAMRVEVVGRSPVERASVPASEGGSAPVERASVPASEGGSAPVERASVSASEGGSAPVERASVPASEGGSAPVERASEPASEANAKGIQEGSPRDRAPVFFDGRLHNASILDRDELNPGDSFDGPAIVAEATGTIVVEPGWRAEVTHRGDILLSTVSAPASHSLGRASAPASHSVGRASAPASHSVGRASAPASPHPTEIGGRSAKEHHAARLAATEGRSTLPSTAEDRSETGPPIPGYPSETGFPKNSPQAADPVQLELFNNRFAAIAEQMGESLRRTALSTNVKERLDFSCAVFDQSGELVVNAPHIPVHLGAMSECVKQLIAAVGPMQTGDVYVTNHPFRGGTHLPDVTVVTPVFKERSGASVGQASGLPGGLEARPTPDAWAGSMICDQPPDNSPLFYVASRAHHAEIGGVVPGSMPPFSRNLAEEGVVIDAFLLARGGRSREAELRELLAASPWPSRRIDENIADIHAQAAANQTGAALLTETMATLGPDYVLQYMLHVRAAAERKMRQALARLPEGRRTFQDALDDGSPLAVAIDIAADSARVDFTGTGPVLPGNLNANRAIVTSAVLYCFRCLIDEDIPLNAGVLAPIEIVLPECLLNPPTCDDPARCAAVAGGNVETSQRMVDAIFGALGVVAASQGTMNNLIFGDGTFGYYETIGGGAGAGPGFDGADAVHTHMTNTRLTDPEVLEDRYPVRLRRFAIRRGSGGAGRHRGGDGIVREIEFLAPLELSLLTQRRLRQPYGLAGGGPGAAGRSVLIRPSAPPEGEELPPLAHCRVDPGDVLCMETPGGGGYGFAAAADGNDRPPVIHEA